MVTKRLEDLPKDLDSQISADFNDLLQSIHADLSLSLIHISEPTRRS